MIKMGSQITKAKIVTLINEIGTIGWPFGKKLDSMLILDKRINLKRIRDPKK